jgi:hypothetical protein
VLPEDLFLPKMDPVPRQPPALKAAIFLLSVLKNFTAKLRASPSHTAARPPPGVCTACVAHHLLDNTHRRHRALMQTQGLVNARKGQSSALCLMGILCLTSPLVPISQESHDMQG